MTTPPEPPAVPEPTAQPAVPSSTPQAGAVPSNAVPSAAPPAPQYSAPATNQYPHTWMNIVSLVTSILGLSIVGIVFGHLGVSRARRGTAELKGLGIAGLIIGYIGLVIAIIFFVVVVVIGVWLAENCVTIDGVTVCD